MRIIPPQRHLFDIGEDIAYFNCSGNSPQLNEARRRLIEGVDTKSHPWSRTGSFFEDAETIRELASELFGGDANGYALIPAASYGLSIAARAVESHLGAGDRILIIDEELLGNVWEKTAKRAGAMLVKIPAPGHGDWTQAVLDRMDRAVKVVALPTCHWTNGTLIDLRLIGAACRDAGCVLIVDATSTLGAVPFSMEKVKPDFLVSTGYKWLLCPYGFGLMYVSERWRTARPVEESYGSEDSSFVKCPQARMSVARRFELGQDSETTILPGAIAALEQLRAWEIESIAVSLSLINARIASHLGRLGFQFPNVAQLSPHEIGVSCPTNSRTDFVVELGKRDIYISRRGASLRFAPHLYVNDHDVNRLLQAFEEVAA